MRTRRRSLRTSLIVPYAALVVVVAAVLTGTYYWSMHRTISQFSQQYMHQVTERISQDVRTHMDGAADVLDVAMPAGAFGSADLRGNVDTLRGRFWAATGLSTTSNRYVYYGSTSGQSIALKRLDTTTAQVRLKTNTRQHRLYYRDLGPGTDLVWQSMEGDLFDPRTRPWFTGAVERRQDFWTAPYIDFSSQSLVVTRSRQVRDSHGRFVGAVATDQSLAGINDFVRQLDVGDRGRAFLTTRDGTLVATKTGTAIWIGTHDNASLVDAAESTDPVVRAAYAAVTADSVPSGFEFAVAHTDSGTFDVAAQHVTDEAGLDWTAIVAIPRDVTFADLYTQLWWGLGLGVLAVAIAVAIGTRIFGRLGGEIASLSGAITRIRKGESEVAIPVHRRDEIGELAENFRAMHDELFTDQLTGVANRTALGNLLTTFTASRQHGMEFTILFIDLNKFKALNDTYGHDNGDRALIEVAERLGQVLRKGDFLARLGGDEFVIILANTASSFTVSNVVSRIKQSVAEPLRTLTNIPDGQQVTLGAAVGAASWPTDGEDADELVKLADEHMYADKGGSSR